MHDGVTRMRIILFVGIGYKVHVGCDESEIVTSVDLLSGNESEGAENNVRSLLEKERQQGMEHGPVVADALYDSAENRKAIHEEKTTEGGPVKAYIPSRQEEKHLDRFRYEMKRDRVICPAKQVSIGKSPHEQGHLYYFSVESWERCEVPLYVVLVRTTKADGHSELWALASTKEYEDPRLARELYKGRMQIEERIDQIKNCWWVGCFTTPNFNADVVHIFFVLLVYTLIQLYLKATHHEELATQTIETL